MNITLVLDFGNKLGGAERRLLRIFNEIGRFHSVTLVARRADGLVFEERCRLIGCMPSGYSRILTCPLHTVIGQNCEALRAMLSGRPDVVVLVDDSGFNGIAARALSMLGIPRIHVMAYGLYSSEVQRGRRNRRLERLLSSASAVDLLYPAQIDFYQSIIQDVSKISVTPGTFTDLNLFRPSIKDRKFAFVAARLESDKNPGLVLDAASICGEELRKKGYTVEIYGTGWEEKHLRNQIVSEGLEDIVKMPGYVKTHEVLPGVNVLCAVGKTENYPSQTIAEAYASGCYVIATDVGDTRSICREDISAFIDVDAQKLADQMCNYMNMSDARHDEIIHMAREYAEQSFSIDRSVGYFTSLCSSVAKAGGA